MTPKRLPPAKPTKQPKVSYTYTIPKGKTAARFTREIAQAAAARALEKKASLGVDSSHASTSDASMRKSANL